MAAFSEDHRRGDSRIAPVPSHVAVRHMEIGNILIVGDMDNLTQTTGLKDLMDFLEEIRESQYMTDQEFALIFLSSLNDFLCFFQRRCDRLFKEHVVAGIECGNR